MRVRREKDELGSLGKRATKIASHDSKNLEPRTRERCACARTCLVRRTVHTFRRSQGNRYCLQAKHLEKMTALCSVFSPASPRGLPVSGLPPRCRGA